MKFFMLSERSSSPHPRVKFERFSHSETYPEANSYPEEFMIPKAELASPFLTSSCPTQHLFCKILLLLLELSYGPTGKFIPLFPPPWRALYTDAFQSKHSQHDLGNEDGTVSFPSCASQEVQRLPSAGQTPQEHHKVQGKFSPPKAKSAIW